MIVQFDIGGIEDAVSLLRESTGKGSRIDPYLLPDGNGWTFVTQLFAGSKWSDIGLDFALEYLDTCFVIQKKENQRIHKGAAEYYASVRHAETGNRLLSESHMLLAFAEDVLTLVSFKAAPQTPASVRLTRTYGYPRRILDEIAACGCSLDQSRALYPEELLMAYQTGKEFLPLTLPFNRHYLAESLDKISRRRGKSTGVDLEMLVSYLFQTLPDTRINWRRRGKGGEIDVIVRDEGHARLARPWSGEYFFAECKDKFKAVDVNDLGHFSSKLSVTKVKAGAIFSRKGLTGRGKKKYAEQFRDLIFNEAGIAIMDIVLDDLKGISSSSDFASLLRRMNEKVRLGT